MLFKGIEPDGHIAKMLTVPEERSYSTSSDESNTSFHVKKEKNSEFETPTEIESKSEEVTVHVEIKVSRKRMLSSPGSKSPSKKVCLDEEGGNATSGDSSEKYFKAITTKKSNDKNEKKCVKDADHSSSETSTGFNQPVANKEHALQLLKDNKEKANLRANELSSSDDMQ